MDWSLVRFVTSSELRFRVLVELREGPLTPTELAVALGKSRSHVSRALAQLSQKRLVRCQTTGKARSKPYEITLVGQHVLDDLVALVQAGGKREAHLRKGSVKKGGAG